MSEKKKKPKVEEIDDGEPVADMNVDGMPWTVRRRYRDETPPSADGKEPEPMTKEQFRTYKWAAIKAGLLVVLVFALAYFLFIAFCDFIWFR